ncbi:MAG: hypothetical protein K6G81_03705 [Lachnospiraceae bacterium]|nr:hypothetical protein [Lachnospiraceae bacterium]
MFDLKNVPLVYGDTVVYFASMVLSVLLWTRYVVAYLDKRGEISGTLLTYAGWTIFTFEIVHLIINFFNPVLFKFEADGEYVPGSGRYITLAIQIVFYLIVAVIHL